jgi:methylmalonyl-CoA/ethylmalonyl-CoA epimerase
MTETSHGLLLKRVDHIGILVRDLEQSLRKYEALFQVKPTYVEVIEELSVRVAFIPVGETFIELLQPLVLGKGRLGQTLEKQGEGFDHIAYRVDDIEQLLADMKGRGVRLRDEKPRAGSRGTRIAFVSLEETNSVLTELVEGEEGN